MISMVNRKSAVIITLLIILGIFFFPLFSPPVEAESSTQIDIKPSEDHLEVNENFYATISIVQDEPIIAVQIDLSFNPSLIQADSVTNGNPDVWNFFQPGTIDNTNGEITGICVTNMGGTVTNPTDCFNITFTAQYTDGTSTLDIHNIGMTNSTGDQITDISKKECIIVIGDKPSEDHNQEPTIQDPLSGPQSGFINQIYNYSISAKDPDDDNIYYMFNWGDDTMLSWQGLYQSEELCLRHHQWEKTGDYELKVKVKDTFGHETNWLSSMNVTIQEQSSSTPENSIPTARFNYEPIHPATGDIVSFHDQSYDPDGNITKYLWDFGDNATSNQKNPTYQYNTNKNRSYIVTLTVWDNNDSLSTTNKQITIQNMHQSTEKTNDKQETPGFELILLFISVCWMIIVNQKRKK